MLLIPKLLKVNTDAPIDTLLAFGYDYGRLTSPTSMTKQTLGDQILRHP